MELRLVLMNLDREIILDYPVRSNVITALIKQKGKTDVED